MAESKNIVLTGKRLSKELATIGNLVIFQLQECYAHLNLKPEFLLWNSNLWNIEMFCHFDVFLFSVHL